MAKICIMLVLPIVQSSFYEKTDSKKTGKNNILSESRSMASLLQCVHHCKRIDASAEVLFYAGLCQCIKPIGGEKGKTLSGSFVKKVEMKEIKDYALKKPAHHSTLLRQDYAYFANDGDLGTVQMTLSGSTNYWYVDMQREVWISYIKIVWNNWELNHARSANSLQILTKTSPNSEYKVCTYIGRPSGLHFQVTCDSLTKARFVKLTNNGRVAIHDFRVFGYV